MEGQHSNSSCAHHKLVLFYTKVLILCALLLLQSIHAKPAVLRNTSAPVQVQKDAAGKEAEINVLGKPDSKEMDVNNQNKVLVNEEKDENKGAIENPLENGPKRHKEENLQQQLEKPKQEVVEIEQEGEDLVKKHPMANAIAAAGNLLPLKDLKLPDHLDAVRMEQDGHLNRDYRKEILLGNHEEFEEGDEEEKENKLRDIFFKVDTDNDHQISQSELEEWIHNKVQEHFDEAQDETERIFSHLDANKDKLVGWDEFHIHFLLAKGYSAEEAKKHAVDYETLMLDPDEKERLIRYKFRWAEADHEPQDNQLTLQEFAAFRHPEQSHDMLERMVSEIVGNLDQNGDGVIKEAEFIALPPGEVDYSFQESDKVWQTERRKEFRNVIDLNGDGILSKDELTNYVDPKNPNHSKLEAENLIQLADSNGDGKLSLSEVMDNADLFIGSKVVDTGRSFHDEF